MTEKKTKKIALGVMGKKDQKKNRCRGDGKQKNLGIGVTGKRTKKSPRADGEKKAKQKMV